MYFFVVMIVRALKYFVQIIFGGLTLEAYHGIITKDNFIVWDSEHKSNTKIRCLALPLIILVHFAIVCMLNGTE